MTEIHRVRTRMTGFQGGPGTITMYALDGPALAADLTTFWHEAKNFFPTTVTLKVDETGDELESTNGQITGAWTVGTQASKVGVYDGHYAAPAGVVVNWMTSVYLDGRRLRGKSYFVPIRGDYFQAGGTIVDASLSSIRAEVATFLANTVDNFVVWHRPTGPEAADGASALVTSAVIPDKVAILRSRRD